MKSLSMLLTFFLLLSSYGISKVWKVPGDCPTIQTALDSCSVGDTVLVAPGTYYEHIVWPNTNGIKLISVNEIRNYEATICDSTSSCNGPIIRIESSIDTSTVIRGFKIQNGCSWLNETGGGICCINSSPTIDNNFITDNSGESGGGIGCKGSSSPIIKNNVIEGNVSIDGGGIICDISSSPQIINNVINNNIAAGFPGVWSRGGGIVIFCNLPVIISGNIISNNASLGSSGALGGGIYCENTSPLIIDNLIIGNEARDVGGGILCRESSPHIIRNAFVNNAGGWESGTIRCYNSSPVIDSCIIINNDDDGIFCLGGSNPQIYYNDIYNNTGYGLRNIDSTVIINAPYNWWGDNSGPYHSILNPSGQGDEVSDNVNFVPWLIKITNEVEKQNIVADKYSLYQNYPNPFNPSTTIKYKIQELSVVSIKVFDVLGNEIKTLMKEEKPAGEYEVEFNAIALPSGIYFYRIQAGDFIETKKMVLMK